MTLREEVLTLLSRVLNDGEPVPSDVAASNWETWDSFRQIEIVLEIEDEFGVEIEDARAPSLRSAEAIVSFLAERLDPALDPP